MNGGDRAPHRPSCPPHLHELRRSGSSAASRPSASSPLRQAGWQATWVAGARYGLAAVFFAVGLNLLGVLPLPSWSTLPAGTKRRGARGALVLGLVFGAALGPCTFAFMAPLLGLAFRVERRRRPPTALLLVALYGLGHGAAIVAAGASAGSVQRWLAWKTGARAARLLRGRRRCRGPRGRHLLPLHGGLSHEPSRHASRTSEPRSGLLREPGAAPPRRRGPSHPGTRVGRRFSSRSASSPGPSPTRSSSRSRSG